MAELTQRDFEEFRDYAQRAEEWAARYAIRLLLTEVDRLRQRERIMREALDCIVAMDHPMAYDWYAVGGAAVEQAKDAVAKLKELEG